MEEADIYLWHHDSPSYGYKLAADYCQHHDLRYGNGLNWTVPAPNWKRSSASCLTLKPVEDGWAANWDEEHGGE
ncbi:MAG: hypothetical protein M0C28_06440 [Candidatus Moduliflexus flocculans]|nr:hypothetical protein [Candidatus Moduliflexus flocculans]